MRLFVALELPADVRETLWVWSAGLSGAAWRRVPAANLHVTLAFLGSRPESDVPVIAEVLADAVAAAAAAGRPAGPPALRCARVVALPPRRPRVVAVGLDETAPARPVAALQETVSAGLAAAGVHAPERRAFLAHVTVARALRGTRGLPPSLAPPECAFGAPAVTLFASRPGAGGSTYVPFASVPL